MRKLTFKATIFALPILCFVGYLERSLRVFPNSYSVKRHAMERALKDTQILITGSSHSFYGIRPSLLSPHAFSLAYVSQNLYYDTRLALKYLGSMPKLTTVVIPISYFSLEGSSDLGAENWREPFYYRIYGIRSIRQPWVLANYSVLALYGPNEARSLMTQGPPSCDVGEDGGVASGGLAPGSTEKLASRAALIRHHGGMRPEYIAENVRRLEELLTALRSRGIRAIFVTTPVYRTYSSGIRRDAYRRMQDTLGSLCLRYGLRYLNHMEDPRFTEADFSDTDHLDLQGATKFTQILRNEIISEAFAERAASHYGVNGVTRNWWAIPNGP